MSRTLAIHNTGTVPLTLDPASLTLPGEFSVVPPSATSVASGETRSLTIRLDAASAGQFQGTLSSTSNDADESRFDFTLYGDVAVPEPEIAVRYTDAYGREPDTATSQMGRRPGASTPGTRAENRAEFFPQRPQLVCAIPADELRAQVKRYVRQGSAVVGFVQDHNGPAASVHEAQLIHYVRVPARRDSHRAFARIDCSPQDTQGIADQLKTAGFRGKDDDTVGPASNDGRLLADLVVRADNDPRTPAVRPLYDGLHPGRRSQGGAGLATEIGLS